MQYRVLVINFGSTSTKVSVFEDDNQVLKVTIDHLPDELAQFRELSEQFDYRKDAILKTLDENGYSMEDFDSVASRGGNCKPISGGIYRIDKAMLADIRSEKYGRHPSGVGVHVAYSLGKENNIPALIADPPITDEFCSYARFSGIKELSRISSGHALNMKRTARKVAEQLGTTYEEMNFVTIHLGGGVTVAAHDHGKMIDLNNSLDGEGPFSPERSGTIIVEDVITVCFAGDRDEKACRKFFKGNGGLVSYLGTNNGVEVEKRIAEGDTYAEEVLHAMAYQIAKEIGAMSCVLKGKVDAIAITGGLAHSERLTGWIKEYTGHIAPVYIVPGENEMLALAEASIRYLSGTEKAKIYEEEILC